MTDIHLDAAYLAKLEDAVMTAEQVVAGRTQEPGKGSFSPRSIFAAADAVRARRAAISATAPEEEG